MHDSLRIGAYWRNINGYEERALCTCCGIEESLEHILVDCTAQATQELRRLLKAILRKKKDRNVSLSLGVLLGATAFTYANKDDKSTAEADRFFRVVVTETVHLIWKIRCERTIEYNGAPDMCISGSGKALMVLIVLLY